MPETKAQCENPHRSHADANTCIAQARADAVKAVAKCMLPFADHPPHANAWYTPSGMIERLEQWRHDRNELDSYQCSVREINSKLPIYSPPKSASYTPPVYAQDEVDSIMQDGMALGRQWAGKGRTRAHAFDRK